MHFVADNIISPLGNTTELNFKAVEAGRSALQHFAEDSVSTEPYVAAKFTEEQRQSLEIAELTRFEALAALSAKEAIGKAGIDVSAPNVVFILSTTKANIENLHSGDEPAEAFIPSVAAQHIANYLGVTTKPLVVCNACISGVAAIITAKRLVDGGRFDYAIVCGADVLSRFTVSGFQSLKALSAEECKPFDIERNGLNLGEAAATIVFSSSTGEFSIEAGTIRNDAFHISSPSKNGEGAFLALKALDAEPYLEDIAFINAHGTATLFNDQMEAVAIERAGLTDIPVNGLKGYFGHTMGAAGILETIISKEALRHGLVLATRGFEETGTSAEINLSAVNRPVVKDRIIKMISGFGGGNAAILIRKESENALQSNGAEFFDSCLTTVHHVAIDSQSASLDGQHIVCQSCGRQMLVELYKRFIADYPKYYKMDPLCRLGLVASGLLLKEKDVEPQAIILFNHSSSSVADRRYWATVSAPDNSFPSPAHFVYTLPNIVTGEIAMRYGIHGETAFFILPDRDERFISDIVNSIFKDEGLNSAIVGWIDYSDDELYTADLLLLSKT